MDDDERRAIIEQARETCARLADLEPRQRAYDPETFPDREYERERDRREKLRAQQPPRPERGLDIDIDAKIAAAISAERETMIEIIAETLALERRDVGERITRLEVLERELERRSVDADAAAKLGDGARKLKAEIATLQDCIAELRGVVANEAKRGSATVFDLPSFRYPKDLN
jgi:hypothetical protein